MYIAKTYFETRFKKIFKKGDVVPAEIAEQYLTKVEKQGDDELLTETPSEVKVTVEDTKTPETFIDEVETEVDKVKDEVETEVDKVKEEI